MKKERRRFVRLDMTTRVKWKNISDPNIRMSLITDPLQDISAGGIRLIAYHPLQLGDELDLEIALPANNLITARGKVVWIKEFTQEREAQSKIYQAGVEFIEIEDKDKELINKMVFQFRTLYLK
jgi:c-di-GMP-binding flagellar brake protein YcgR